MKSCSLESSYIFHTLCILECRPATSLLLKFTQTHSRNLDKNIDTVKYRSRKPRTIPLDRHTRTYTRLFSITEKSTWTWVHRSDERKSRGISRTLVHSIDRDLTVLEWLAKCLEDMLVELEELIEEEYPSVCQRDLSWSRVSTTTDDGCFARCVVDDAKWSLADDRSISREESRDRVYARELDLLLDIHRGKYPSKSLGKHGFPTSWRSLHEDVVSSGCRDEECSLRLLLSVDRGKVHSHMTPREARHVEWWYWSQGLLTSEECDGLTERLEWDDIDIRDD